MLDQMQLFKNWCYSNYNAAYTSNSDIENALNTHAENLRQYERYTRKLSLLGDNSGIRRANCYIDNKTGKICCNKLIACLDNSRINEGQAVQENQDIVQLFVEIPDFVEELVTSGESILDFNNLAVGRYVSLRVKYNGNRFNKTYERLFYNMKKVAYLNLTEFSFDNVVNARQMFKKSYNLIAVRFKPGTYDTLLYTSGMFEECHQLNRVNLDEVRIPKLFSMNGMFYKCSALKSIDLSFLCEGRYLSDMQYAFYSQGIEQISLNQLEPRELNPDSLIDLRQLCQMCFNLTKMQINNGKQNQIPVNNMDGIAYECPKLNEIDLSQLDMQYVRNLSLSFTDCCRLKIIDLSNKNLSNLDSIEQLLQGCHSLEVINLQNSVIGKLRNQGKLFYEVNSNLIIDITGTKFIKSDVLDIKYNKKASDNKETGDNEEAGDNKDSDYYILTTTIPKEEYREWVNRLYKYTGESSEDLEGQKCKIIRNPFKDNRIQLRNGKNLQSLKLYSRDEVVEAGLKLDILNEVSVGKTFQVYTAYIKI